MAQHRAEKHVPLTRRPLVSPKADVDAHAPVGSHRASGRSPRAGDRGSAVPSGPTTRLPRLVSRRGLVGAAVIALAAAGAVWVQSGRGGAVLDPTSASGPASSVSSFVPQQVGAARPAPDVSPAAGSFARGVTGSTVTATNDPTSTAITGLRDRRERAVSRDAHREARTSAKERRLQAVTEKAARERKAALAKLAAGARRHAEQVAANTWHLPVTAGVYHLTSRFGECSSLWSSCHTGLDFAAPEGTPIRAVAAGTVTEVGYAGAYGNRTIVSMEDGTEMWYCHQSATTVQQGAGVVAGQVVGSVGSTGNTTGPHLHLEVRPRPDSPVDPFATMVSHGLRP